MPKKFHSTVESLLLEDEIFSSSFAAAMYSKLNNFPQKRRVYVIGGEGILEELPARWIYRSWWSCWSGCGWDRPTHQLLQQLQTRCPYNNLKLMSEGNHRVWKPYAYVRILVAFYCYEAVMRWDSMTDLLQEWPGAGCMVAAMCGSTEREPIVAWKTINSYDGLLITKVSHQYLQNVYGGVIELDTDILFGQNAGCKTLLVLSAFEKNNNAITVLFLACKAMVAETLINAYS
ncbi:hypothetical protein POTOM_052168 [Populus tomentosa]|uniref:Uncharacterized protein n=1 Tax=Populus tomentosa TaxID=118781 RepID=A0A8X7Y3M4_POPTO|nr:hypothetical protein POTOM_052168 [Populus tomentosa]